MKFRLLLLTAALLAFSSVTPQVFSQDQSASTPTAQTTPAQTTPDQTTPASRQPDPDAAQPSDSAQSDKKPAEAPVQAADPAKVKHDGGKNDVDAIGNRKIGAPAVSATGTRSKARFAWASSTPRWWIPAPR